MKLTVVEPETPPENEEPIVRAYPEWGSIWIYTPECDLGVFLEVKEGGGESCSKAVPITEIENAGSYRIKEIILEKL